MDGLGLGVSRYRIYCIFLYVVPVLYVCITRTVYLGNSITIESCHFNPFNPFTESRDFFDSGEKLIWPP